MTPIATQTRIRSNADARLTALVSPGINIVRALEARGIEAEPLLRRAGCDPALFHVPEARIRSAVIGRVFELAEQATGDPCFGIEVGKQVRGVALHALGYAWLAAATLGEAMARMVRYTRVLTEYWRAELREEPTGARFVIVYNASAVHGPLSRHDALLAGLLKLCRITYGDAFTPLEVTVERAPPDCAAVLADWFRAPIVWRASQPSLLCRREDLARPLATANPGVAVASEQLVTDYLARLDREDVVARVKRELLARFPAGAPTLGIVARALGTSDRTLHRRLAAAQTSFEKLADEVRRDLALAYLGRSGYSVGEVAFLLGFAETSSFNRAFRRWTGRSPSAFRAAGPEAGAGEDERTAAAATD